MTTLQEAARNAIKLLEELRGISYLKYEHTAIENSAKELRTALAQQGEQPVAYMAKNKNGGTESLIRARLLEQIGRSDDHDYTPLYAGVAPAPGEQRCTYCDGTGDVHGIDGEWRGTCPCAAAPAPQPAQGEPVYQYQMADGSWIDQIKDSYDYNRKYAPNATVRVVYTAAPAPQAQDWKKEPEYVPPLVKWAQEQPAQASGRTNLGDETGGAVERFGWQTFLGKSPEIVPATNGSFVWYSDYLKLWQSAQPIGINGMVEATTRPAIDAASKQGGQHE